MNIRPLIPLVLLFASTQLGCIASTVAQATPGKAYLIKGHIFGTQTYNCMDAASGPVCHPVIEEKLK